LYLPVTIIFIALTRTRSAWVGAAILIVIYASIADRRYLLCLLLIPLVFYIPGVEERLVDLESGGNDPHNVYVQIFFEMGIFGLVTFVWLIASLFIKLRKQYSFDKGGFIIMTALLASYLIACSSDNMLDYLAFQWYFWFFMDIVCAWNRLE